MSSQLTAEQIHLLNDYDPALQSAGLGTLLDRVLRDKAEATLSKEADDAAAGTVTGETAFYENTSGRDRTIVAAKFIPSAALTAHASTYATLLVDKRLASDYTTAVPVASATTEVVGTGNWIAFTPVSLGALLQTTLEAGAVLTFEITKASTGVIVPRGVLVIELD